MTISSPPAQNRSGSHQKGIEPPFFGCFLFPFFSSLAYLLGRQYDLGMRALGQTCWIQIKVLFLFGFETHPLPPGKKRQFTHKPDAIGRGWLGWPRSLRLKSESKGFWLGHLQAGGLGWSSNVQRRR